MGEKEKKGFFYWINNIENNVLVAGFAIIIAVAFFQVVMRTVFNSSLTWSEELIRYVYIWLCWAGVSLTERRGEHIQLTFLVDLFPKVLKRLIAVLETLLMIVFTAWLVYLGTGLMFQIFKTGAMTTALKIPMFIVYMAFPFGCLMYCLRKICKLPLQIKVLLGRGEV
ncbi:MAG: TRAP transporter small permease [Bacillota bacterium]